ncbi:MAG: ROK family protein [Blautia sp.]|nr:ROK family protein [Blautia sp.]
MANRQITNIEVKKTNRNRIFRYILKHGTVSNPDISYALKISLPTVTQNTKELLERGLIRETGELESTGGRRAKALAVAEDYCVAVGLDITRNHVGMMLVNLTGEILKYDRSQFPYENEEMYYRGLNRRLEQFLEGCVQEREKILGIGIAFPGIVDLQRKEITYSHALDVRDLPFSGVSGYFNYPCSFFNDANAGAYAEGINGTSKEPFFYLSLSNTVGGAVFEQDRLMHGRNFRCGEAGHMTIVPGGKQCYCGKDGCLDAYCSARLLSDAFHGKLDLFFAALKKGEEEAVGMWEEYTTNLALAVNNIHMILDCDVVLGGYVGSYVQEHLPGIRQKVFERNTFEEDGDFIKACNYRVGAAALGAAQSVIEEFISHI